MTGRLVPPGERTRLVAEAERTIRAGSKSFRAASRLFDQRTRERAWLLYSWCRHCDDACDGQELGGSPSAPRGSFDRVEILTRRALAGERTGVLPFDALAAVAAECAIPGRLVEDHLAGFRLDVAGWRPEDEADLVRYCYHVAGAVGCLMAVVMGVPPDDEETLARAADLGIAFQLSNIARDLREDFEAGRCYVPAAWLRERALDAADPDAPELVPVAARIVDLAMAYEESALPGVARLPFRCRWAVLSARGIYGGIGRAVAARGAAAWDRRVVIPRGKKLGLVLQAFAGACRPRAA